MKRPILLLSLIGLLTFEVAAQTTVNVPRPQEKEKAERAEKKTQEKIAQRTTVIEFRGEQAFTEKDLRSQLKEQIATIDQYGLTAARADDLAFFLELVYHKHGFARVDVHYIIESSDRLRLDIKEGPRITLGKVIFEGNEKEPADKLFDFAVGPTRERYSRLEKRLPFVEADLREGADLVRRLYVAEGFLDVVVDPPRYVYRDDTADVTIPVHEGKQYFFGNVTFAGQKIYDAETLRGQIVDLLQRPYTEARVADIPRRLQSYFKSRGYYDVKVTAAGAPEAARDAHVPVQVAISAGPLYHFGDEIRVSGLQRLRPSYVTKRFTRLRGKTYSPETLDERFRVLMQTGLFNLLQVKPVSTGDDLLGLEIAAEEAKPKEFGISVGYGTFPGAIFGVQYRDLNMFGYGRPITTSAEISQRSYKGEIVYEDPFFFDTDFSFRARLAALTFDFDGYSKFEIGGRLELTRKLIKQDEAGVVFAVRHVDVTSEGINPIYLGPTSYFANTLGFSNTVDFRDSPLVTPRGFILNNTLDLALNAFGSDIEFVRTTARFGYYLPFGPKPLAAGVVGDVKDTPLERWFRGSAIAFGARGGLIHSLTASGADEATEIPIDERFFNGGADTVRSFGERELGPHDPKGNPIGGEFFTIFNIEYTFPIIGELQGAVFADAGNLLPSSEHPSLDDMRYGLGMGLRYKLPIGPIRLDYGFNPDPHENEDSGAFHFSFGFAF
jgi:outer membrane protein assembly complex protein YaeT